MPISSGPGTLPNPQSAPGTICITACLLQQTSQMYASRLHRIGLNASRPDMHATWVVSHGQSFPNPVISNQPLLLHNTIVSDNQHYCFVYFGMHAICPVTHVAFGIFLLHKHDDIWHDGSPNLQSLQMIRTDCNNNNNNIVFWPFFFIRGTAVHNFQTRTHIHANVGRPHCATTDQL